MESAKGSWDFISPAATNAGRCSKLSGVRTSGGIEAAKVASASEIRGSPRLVRAIEAFPLPVGALGFGGVAGLVVGYAAKKLTKLAALFLGAVFVLLQVLAYCGWITIDWGHVEQATQAVWRGPHGATLAGSAWRALAANLPVAGGFAGGFAVGFKFG